MNPEAPLPNDGVQPPPIITQPQGPQASKRNLVWMIITAVFVVLVIVLAVLLFLRAQAIANRQSGFVINSEQLTSKLTDPAKYSAFYHYPTPGTTGTSHFALTVLDGASSSKGGITITTRQLKDASDGKGSSQDITELLLADEYTTSDEDGQATNLKAVGNVKVKIDGSEKTLDCFSADVSTGSDSKTQHTLGCSYVRGFGALLVMLGDSEHGQSDQDALKQFDELIRPNLEVTYES